MQGLPLRPISVDFEYIPADDGSIEVVCVVARDLWSGEVTRRFGDELGQRPPFPIGPNSVMVAYFAAAEIEAFLSLGWDLPAKIIDLYAEHMRLTNGLPSSEMNGVPSGARGSLLAALKCHGLPARAHEAKRSVIARILAGPPYNSEERGAILDYCQEDVDDASALLKALLPQMEPRWLGAALLRGQYCVPLAYFGRNGHPVDADMHDRIVEAWDDIRRQMVRSIEDYGVHRKEKFDHLLLEDLLGKVGADADWPLTPTGARKTDQNTLRQMSVVHPKLARLCDTLVALGQMKKIQPLAIGSDGRARLGKRDLGFRRLGLSYSEEDTRSVGWGAYRSKTGRNQPKASEFVMLRNNWWRTMVTPTEGRALLYADWSSQEIAIAAFLSGDRRMIEHYESGDFYLGFGRSAGLVPIDATKASHGEYRSNVLKPVSLGTLYGQQKLSMAARIGRPVQEADDLLRTHVREYSDFWSWTRNNIASASLEGKIETVLGWSMRVGDFRQTALVDCEWITEGIRETTLQNWPMQSTGGDILRVATIALARAGIRIAFPLHDAVLIESDLAEIDELVPTVRSLMEGAAKAVLGRPIPVDVDVVRPGENLRGAKGDPMWRIVERALKEQERVLG